MAGLVRPAERASHMSESGTQPIKSSHLELALWKVLPILHGNVGTEDRSGLAYFIILGLLSDM